MKITASTILAAWLAILHMSMARPILNRNLRGGGKHSLIICTGIILEENFGDGTTETKLACELESRIYLVEVDNVWLETVIENNELVSEETTLSLTNYEIVGSVIQSTTRLNNPPSLTRMSQAEIDQRRKLSAPVVTGTKTVLAINVVHKVGGNVYGTSFTDETLSADLFTPAEAGSDYQYNTLHSQVLHCSNQELNFQPAEAKTSSDSSIASDISNGVTTVTVSTACPGGLCDNTMVNDVNDALKKAFGTSHLANHVLYCLPLDKTRMSSVAWAFVNNPISVYRDKWCLSLAAQMHEIGHNLKLAHSGEGEAEYGDKSGMLGTSFGDWKGNRRCYNAAKNWQLGWYSEYQYEYDATDGLWEGELVGISEIAGSDPSSYKAIVKINDPDDKKSDFFVSFNRKTSFNADTAEGGDQVLIHERAGESQMYTMSLRVAELDEGGSYETSSGVTVTVISINTIVYPAIARIQVSYPIAPTTPAPVGVQTGPPSSAPISIPTFSPVAMPAYQALASGSDGSASISTMEECRVAGLAVGAVLRNGQVVGPGQWGHVPCGCSYQSAGDMAIHFKNDFASCGQAGDYTPIVKVEAGASSNLAPSSAPSGIPSSAPSRVPSSVPSGIPSSPPSRTPSSAPSKTPSSAPSRIPSASPITDAPTDSPITDAPTGSPVTDAPVSSPTNAPISAPIPDTYMALQRGRAGSKSITTIEECKTAGVAVGGKLRDGHNVIGPGAWRHVPCGCSLQSDGDMAIHFMNDFTSCEQEGDYTPVIKIDYFTLPQGSNGSDSITTIGECQVAGLKVGGVLKDGIVLLAHSRPTSPCGCSIQTSGSSNEIIFNNNFASCSPTEAKFSPIIRKADSYVTLRDGSHGTDSIGSLDECMIAGLAVGGILRGGTVQGTAGPSNLPCGCSIESGGDRAVYFRNDFGVCANQANANYTPVVKNDYTKLLPGASGSNSIQTLEECRLAGLIVGGILRDGTNVVSGAWRHVPCGCTIQSSGDMAIHFNSDFSSCGQEGSNYSPVARS